MKNDKNIAIKGTDKGSAVVVWDKEDYIKEAEKQFGDIDAYEEVPDDPGLLISTIHRLIGKRGDLKKKKLFNILKLKTQNLLYSICYLKYINDEIMYLADL